MPKDTFAGFYKKTLTERQDLIAKEFVLTPEQIALLTKEGSLPHTVAERMVENVIGTFPLPLGIATNFVIDGKEYIIPFAIEEASVVAAASNGAKLSRGFTTSADDPIMLGHIQLVGVKNPAKAKALILKKKKVLLKELSSGDSTLLKLGGGPRNILVEILKTSRGTMLEVQLLVDVRDAMGANAINTMLEKLAPLLEELTGGESRLKIISNLAIYRKARAHAVWTKKALEESIASSGIAVKGEEIVDRILDAYAFAVATPFRATTHNKGIMNGIDAVVMATGNDTRAVEAGAHAFASYKKEYGPLTKFSKNKNGDLVGEIELPLTLGLVGGATKVHPVAQLSLKILGVTTAQELARVAAAVGLAQNFAALRAIVTTGIQAGHMRMHSKNIAAQAGATDKEIDAVAAQMVVEKNVSQANAEKIILELRKKT